MWTAHTTLTVQSKQVAGAAFVGKASFADKSKVDDQYRTNRFDLFSHYVRAFEHLQPMPLRSVDQITSPVGRSLVALLDQHISDTDALQVKQLAAKNVFDSLTSQQTDFLNRLHDNERAVISGSTPDAIVARELLRVRLLARTSSDPVFAGANIVGNSNQLIATAKAFDPVSDVLANGVKVINILANVYVSIAQKRGPQRYEGDILTSVPQHYAALGVLIANEPYFQKHQAENVATLAKAGLSASGNMAQDVWNAHLVQVAILVDAETTYDAALKAGTVTEAQTMALKEARDAVTGHSPQLAGLFSMTFGIPPYKVLGFPAPNLL